MFDQQTPVILDMAHLKSSGVLYRPMGKVELDVGLPIWVTREQNALHIIVPKVDYSISSQFSQSDLRFWNHFTIDIAYRELRYGQRPYFICPMTKMDCLKLVILDELICSIGYFRNGEINRTVSFADLQYLAAERKILKQDGTRRLSSANRERLIATLQQHPERYKSNATICRLIERNERRRERKNEKRLRENRALSTTTALDCGRGINQYQIFEEFEQRDSYWIDQLPIPPLPPVIFPDFAKEYPELDIKVLIDRVRFGACERTGRSLGWGAQYTDNCTIYMFTLTQPDELPRLVFAFENNYTRERVWQAITLLPGPRSGKARYFLCPVTHVRCETIYYRNGLFASREAHRLSIKAG